jgi:hypothetical protein
MISSGSCAYVIYITTFRAITVSETPLSQFRHVA